MDRNTLNADARSLEEAFFARQNAELLQKLRKKAEHKERREALRQVVPRADDAMLDHLIQLGLGPETVLALILVPLALVAWADGEMDPRERAATLRAAEERGINPGTPAHEMLGVWLERPPSTELVAAWKKYAHALWGELDEAEQRLARERMLGMARAVAEAAGGFLGLRSKISAAEQGVLEELGALIR